MPANTTPRFTATGRNSTNGTTGMGPVLTTAAADYDGTGANNSLVFTSGSNGSRIVGLRFVAKGSNTQSVARIYLNNGSTNGTGTNNALIASVTLPQTTASNTSNEPPYVHYFEGGYLDLEASWRIYCGLATTVSAGWQITPVQAGDF